MSNVLRSPIVRGGSSGLILLVDDDPSTLELTAMPLELSGYTVVRCNGGAEALRALETRQFDLVILDLLMPGMDGSETLTKLRMRQDEASLPVIMATGSARREDIVKCLDLGANDYITKPVDLTILLARVRSQLNVSRAAQREITIGASIQRDLLIGSLPKQVEGLEAAAMTVASRRVDGDFYEFYEHGGGVVDLIVGDAMGKGVPAALLGAATKMNFSQAVSHFLARRSTGSLPKLERIVERVNARMVDQLIALESFVAMSAVRLDLVAGRLTLVNCGNTPLLVFKKAGGGVMTHGGESMPLGFGLEDQFSADELTVDDGDVIFLYSDGLTEARSPEGAELGVERVRATLAESGTWSARAILRRMEALLRAHCLRDTFDDDVTCVVLKVKRVGVQPLRRRAVHRLPSCVASLRSARRLFREAMSQAVDGDLHRDGPALELAVNEVVANIVEHAHGRDASRSFEIALTVDPTHVTVELSYEGAPFDGSQAPDPAFDGVDEHGYGLYIVREVVDEVTYASRGSVQTVVLRHRLHGASRGGGR